MYGRGVRKPARSMIGKAIKVILAPPVIAMSVKFIASSIAIIEISDIPSAVRRARLNAICLQRINVSRMIEVKRPLKIASAIMAITGHAIL